MTGSGWKTSLARGGWGRRGGVTLFCAMLATLPCGCGSSEGPDKGHTYRVFVTSVLYEAALGGLPGADQKCQTAADSAVLGGTFKAWLSTAAVNAIDRFVEVGPYYFVERQGYPMAKIFNNKVGLAVLPLSAINIDERGRLVLDNSADGVTVHTGTKVGGTVAGDGHCQGWTVNQGKRRYGLAYAADAGWTDSKDGDCSSKAHLYCLEQ